MEYFRPLLEHLAGIKHQFLSGIRDSKMQSDTFKERYVTKVIDTLTQASMGPSRSCWNGTTSALQPEEITSKGTRVSCVYYQ